MRFCVGVNAVGTWDELFVLCTCFALLRRHFPVWVANLLQGWVFTRTGSLTYVLAVHLLFDAIVFLAIVHAHNPQLVAILVC